MGVTVGSPGTGLPGFPSASNFTLQNTVESSQEIESVESTIVFTRQAADSFDASQFIGLTEPAQLINLASAFGGASSLLSFAPYNLLLQPEPFQEEQQSSSSGTPEQLFLPQSLAQYDPSTEESADDYNIVLLPITQAEPPQSQQQVQNFEQFFEATANGESSSLEIALLESDLTVDGISLASNEMEMFEAQSLEESIDIEGVVINANETELAIGEPELIKNLMASIEPAIEQPGFGTQFLVINQYPTRLNPAAASTRVSNEAVIVDANESDDGYFLQPSDYVKRSWDVERSKDVVWYGRIGTYPASVDPNATENYQSRIVASEQDFYETKFGEVYDKVYPVTLNVSGSLDPNEEGSFYVGNLRVAAPARATSITKNSVALPLTKTSPDGIIDGDNLYTTKRSYMYGESIGGRNLFDVSNGRSYVAGVVGGKKLEELIDYKELQFEKYDVPDKVSPYLLMPEDELLLACVVQPAPYDPSDYLVGLDRNSAEYLNQPSIEANIPKFKTRISGPGRVIFYGSYLRDGWPMPPESAQPLTSQAVHEDINSGLSPYGAAHCLDQFQLEPVSSLRGGYLDRVIVGNVSESVPLPLDPRYPELFESYGDRFVAGSVVDGQAGSAWSVQRFVRVYNDRETYYDSHVPPVRDIMQRFDFLNPEIVMDLTDVNQDLSILRFFPFDPVLSGSVRASDVNDAAKSDEPGLLALQNYELNVITVPPTAPVLTVPPDSMTSRRSVSLLFGIGDNYGLPFYNDVSNGVQSALRGYRYGLSGIFPKGRSAVFRHDRYGQLRDMLETSGDSITFGEPSTDGSTQLGLVPPPIRVRFVDRDTLEFLEDPALTSSQNLSFFATSELPYFDGQAVDRGDVPSSNLLATLVFDSGNLDEDGLARL
jgi:hypothetical protein